MKDETTDAIIKYMHHHSAICGRYHRDCDACPLNLVCILQQILRINPEWLNTKYEGDK